MQISKFAVFTATLALLPAMQGKELYPAGDFEGKSEKPLYIRRFDHTGGKRTPIDNKGKVIDRIQADKAYAGKQSLLLETGIEGSHELNLNGIKWDPSKKYEMTCRCFIEKSNPAFKFEGRVTFVMPDKKYKYHFPQGTAKVGEWNLLKQPFTPPAGTLGGSITVWIGKGPYKVYVDDLSLKELGDEPAKK